jgi:serine/threonine protein kinase
VTVSVGSSLEIGTRLGVYEIAGVVGRGGMGEVYRGRDDRLGRDVAIKVISSRLAAYPEELERFSNEARILAAVQHPNIVTIYDVGSSEGVVFTVMELLRGKNLRQRMAGGPLPWRTAAAIGIAAASGLAAAHARGIVHRDLKPENVFLLADGGVKLLDFGLAHNLPTAAAPTLGAISTGGDEGGLIGTIHYMSPEQVSRTATDERTDIFTFGCILFEMLAGNAPFARMSLTDSMVAILHDPPPAIPTEGKTIPPALVRVVRRCLEKEPTKRFQNAFDLAFALSEIAAGVPVGTTGPTAWKQRLLWFIAGLVAGAGATVLAFVLT